MKNMLLENIEYRVELTRFGVWRRFMYPTGAYFSEYKTRASIFGLPIIHFTRGICPETGRRITAKGIFACGRLAVGVFSIGQASAGLFSIGQLTLGLLFGLGQAAFGFTAFGQAAGGMAAGVGQLASGWICVAQMGIGKYVLAQMGAGTYVWSVYRADLEAVNFFQTVFETIIALFP